MTADARTAWPGVTSFHRPVRLDGASNMLRLNPEILSFSEFLSLLMPDPLPAGELDAAAYWRLLSEPWVSLGTHTGSACASRVPRRAGPGQQVHSGYRDPADPGHRTAAPERRSRGFYDEVEAFVAWPDPSLRRSSAPALDRAAVRSPRRARLGRALGQFAAVDQPAGRPVSRRQVRAPLPRRARVWVLI